MLKFIIYFICAIIGAIFLWKFGYIDEADIPQNATNALAMYALYEICKH